MGNQLTKSDKLLDAASHGDIQYVQQCMAEAETREKLLLKSKTGFMRHNEGVLHLAAKHGQLHTITAVLGPTVDAVTVEIAEGQYPGKAAELLTKLVNQTDGRGRTPFLTACYNGFWDCAEQLLEAGSNIFAVDRDGNGCLHLAAVNGHTDVVSELLNKADHEAILLRLVSPCNLSGFTPLHYAAHSGSAEITRQLLAAGVDQLQGTTADYDRWMVVPQGTTALHIAAMSHQSGVCIMLLQQYVLQLREWLPGDPVPVDPRIRADSRGNTPLQVALWKGLEQSSQLAICLNPRFDIQSVFSTEQLDTVRRRGPAALKVLAAAALKSTLLQQLLGLKDEQQQLLALQRWEREQRRQQQQQLQRKGKSQADRQWQRWWVRGSTEEQRPAAAVAAGSSNTRSSSGSSSVQRVFETPLYQSSSAMHMALGNGSKQKPPNSSSNGGSTDNVTDYLQGLHRTPSITLGAVQYSSAAAAASLGEIGAEPEQISSSAARQQQQQQQDGHMREVAAPEGPLAGHTAAPRSAAAAAAGDSSRSSSPERRLQTASSITLGCLDQVWKHSEQQQQLQDGDVGRQQQQELNSVLGPLEAETLRPAKNQQQQHGEIEALEHSQQQQQQQQEQEQEQPAGSRPNSRLADTLEPNGRQSPGAAAAAGTVAAAAAADTYKHINEHIHRATGCTKSFMLVTPSGTGSSSCSSSSSSSSSSAADATDGAAAKSQQQQLVPPTPKQQVQQPRRQRSLGANSITLAQLQRSSTSGSSVGGDLSSSSNAVIGSSSSNAIVGSSSSNRHARNAHKVLTTAGISNTHIMTPFAYRLFQQQQMGYAAAAAASMKQQQIGQTFCQLPAASSTAASHSSSSMSSKINTTTGPGSLVATSQTAGSSRPSSHLRSPHRRSFELPGSKGTSLSAVFGANRQHVARMLREANASHPQSFNQSGSIQSSSTAAVATSLGGALPGCISTKLVQCVDLSRSSSRAFSNAADLQQQHSSSNARILNSAFYSRTSSIDVGRSLGNNGSELCAICVERPPAVAVAACGHTMCFECVRVIVQEGVGCRAPLCPFCRVNMSGFKLATAAAS